MQRFWQRIAEILLLSKLEKRWQKVARLLAIAVVFCTTYMLILPAVTMEQETYCGFEAHTHDESCYVIQSSLSCPYKEIEAVTDATTQEAELTEEETTLEVETTAEEEKETTAESEETAVKVEETTEAAQEESTATAETTEEETTKEMSQTQETTEEASLESEETTAEEEPTDIQATTDSAELSHTHSADCYVKKEILTCTLTEHLHEDVCFIEELATQASSDDESAADEEEKEHTHSEDCYTKDEILACTEWGQEEPWSLDWESEEFRDKAVKYVTYLINQLPDIDEFENKLDRLDLAEDYEGYEEYYKEVYAIATRAWVNYENLGLEIGEEVPNKADLLEYEWLYSAGNSYAVTETRTVEFVNYYDSSTAYKSVLIHSGNVGAYSSFGFWYWYAVRVEENEYGDLIVREKYDYTLKDKSAVKPETAKGFILLSHGDSNTFDCEVGDEATVNFDYLNTSGKNTSSFGTVTFSEYVEPEPEVEVKQDAVLETGEPSDEQVKYAGATITTGDKNVKISKTIDGTDIENVFDITLTVQTKTNVQTFLSEPDMAVVIVMDISNTMNSTFTDDTMSRYDAAVTAASSFINQFAENTAGLSKIGFVAFNTHAHEIFALQPCSTAAQVSSLINEMSTETDAIISASGYSSARTRFTNVEGGLKRAYDMLEASGNSNQYVILLTDGFPTTYLVDNSADSTNYNGYEPYTTSGTVGTDGVFYDSVLKTYCKYGTSYSDKAAIRAREMATYIKDQGAKIFSVGVDVAGQTVQEHINNSSSSNSIVDRTGTTYEIGGAADLNAYKNWLGNSIGSEYYYDSTDQKGISTAFNQIFQKIIELNGQNTKTVWTATDPLPILDEGAQTVEFIYFYDKEGNVSKNPEVLTGEFAEGAEDTANHKDGIIYWDLKKSGYITSVDPGDANTTYYHYNVTYRVRLQNENKGFIENNTYETNGDAFLEYRTIVTTNGVQEISDSKTVYFPKPSVNGYLSEFSFTKTNNMGSVLPGAEFTLVHDTAKCSICQGNGTSVVDVTSHIQVSNEEGAVSFTGIPSGHIYYMEETVIPEGYVASGSEYIINVAYNVITITEILTDGTEKIWTGINDTVTNIIAGHVLPETGGIGTIHLYIIGGLLTALSSVFLLCYNKKKDRERRGKRSKA